MALLAVLLIYALAPAARARADGTTPDDIVSQVGFDQHLDAPVPLDLAFRDEAGQPVRLADYFGHGPVILTLNYYRCPNLCSLVLGGLDQALQDLSLDVGQQFTIVTVSIDPGDTPASAAAKKAELLARYPRPGAAAGWHFLTGEEPAIRQLAGAVGFRYAYDARQQQYAHPSGIMILTPAGKVARYLFGIVYSSRDLRLGLVEASQGTIGSPADHLLLLCYHYDPVTGRYNSIVDTLVKAVSIGVALALAALILGQVRREWRNARRAEG